ncbi:anti-sigma-D factor RsdA [Nocardia testacea]|uniref:anti-sigma-D factor RsdA n=1 Tax=Nocardia testacea TaxID=248551 RepID=UPI0002F37D6D|nr:anti-sigma-D factor RsdA [Nocardia testacea]
MARDGGRGRGDKWARRASRNTDPYAEGSGTGSEPVDIVAVRRDDELIDAIARGGPVPTESTEELQLATLLADWRAEIVAPPLPDAPDLDTVVAAVNQEIGARQARISAQSGGRLRLLRPIATTAAALALVFGGLSAFSYQAEPGDALWRVKEVVFSEQAQSTVVQYAGDDLAAAQTLLEQGKPDEARERLEQASANTTQVDDPTKRNELVERWNQLFEEVRKVIPPDIAAQLEQVAPSPDPGAPVPSHPGGTTERPGSTVTTTPGPGSELPFDRPSGPGGSDKPGAPDVPAPDRPGPGTERPDTQAPDTHTPDTPAPDTQAPDIAPDGTTVPGVPGTTTPNGPGVDSVEPPTQVPPSTISTPGPAEPSTLPVPQTVVPAPSLPQQAPTTVPLPLPGGATN